MRFSDDQLSALTEVVNLGVGQAAHVLNQIVGSHVNLTVPAIKLVRQESVHEELSIQPEETLACVDLPFQGEMSGVSSLVFPTSSAATLVQTLLGEAGPADLDSEKIGTLTEIGNMVLNGIMGAISNISAQSFDYAVPSYAEGSLGQLMNAALPKEDDDDEIICLVARTEFGIESLGVLGNVLLFLEMKQVHLLLHKLGVSDLDLAAGMG